ncbi:biotin/lipoyl-containing protein [Pseudomonas fragi]|uniref:biotin/lipoyl-containing protein n=2 Tax=Pseudomonas fragi TaxID=296 RepID=UPI00381C9398
MSNEEIRQLARWLSEAGLGGVELQRPGVQLVLKRHLESVAAHESIDPPTHANQVSIRTCGLGQLLLSHPDQPQVLIAEDNHVDKGQIVALLQVGDLLLPVRSPQAGHISQVLLQHGATVGYGEAIMQLEVAS